MADFFLDIIYHMPATRKRIRATRKRATRVIRKHKKKKIKHKKTYRKYDFRSGQGMLTSVWGPPVWLFLHTVSFNYPVHPTRADKKHYRRFIDSLRYILPCGHCRMNLKKNLKMLPLRACDLKNRDHFSRWVFKLHELINTMLGKHSGLTYCDVRERYEHFRSRCTKDIKVASMKKLRTHLRKTRKKEQGCTESLYGRKAKCVVKIIPHDKRVPSFQIDKKCMKKRI